jgi:hypothetical protein
MSRIEMEMELGRQRVALHTAAQAQAKDDAAKLMAPEELTFVSPPVADYLAGVALDEPVAEVVAEPVEFPVEEVEHAPEPTPLEAVAETVADLAEVTAPVTPSLIDTIDALLAEPEDVVRYERAHLERIAETQGVAGLRLIGVKFGVKGRAKAELIEEILAAQG